MSLFRRRKFQGSGKKWPGISSERHGNGRSFEFIPDRDYPRPLRLPFSVAKSSVAPQHELLTSHPFNKLLSAHPYPIPFSTLTIFLPPRIPPRIRLSVHLLFPIPCPIEEALLPSPISVLYGIVVLCFPVSPVINVCYDESFIHFACSKVV